MFFTSNRFLNPGQQIAKQLSGLNSFSLSNNKNLNLGQKVGDKLTKLREIGFSMEYFIADLFAIFYQKT